MTATPPPIALDAPATDFRLPAIDGRTYAFADVAGRSGTVIVFICNHCPYVKAVIDRLVADARVLMAEGIGFGAICSNDAKSYPEDSFPEMQRFAKAHVFPFPYLHDESQQAARDWAAQTTPHVYVLDADLLVRYEGAPDADHMDPALDAAWLREALDEVLSGREVSRAETEPVGCSIKWKQ